MTLSRSQGEPIVTPDLFKVQENGSITINLKALTDRVESALRKREDQLVAKLDPPCTYDF